MTRRIVLAGGGSGGHAYPLVAVAQALRDEAQKKGISLELLIMGDGGGFLQDAARKASIPFRKVLAGKMRRYISPLALVDLVKFGAGFVQALWYLFWFMPDLVFTKGGYDSVPVALAGRLYLIPLTIHESDVTPGLANRILAPFARAVFLAFKSSEQYFAKRTTVVVGNPTRKELFGGDRTAALASFQLSPDRKTILIIGGSQGAKQINDIILDSLVLLVKDYQIIHQCGASQYNQVKQTMDTYTKEGKEGYGRDIANRYRVFGFLDEKQLAAAYAAADVIISRAGAGSLFEIAAVGKPAIVIPLIVGSRGEQMKNAVEFAKFGGVIMEGANLSTHILLNQIQSLLEPARYADVSTTIKQFATPDAAAVIATALLG